MTIKLVTDSTCDLPSELLKKYKISVVPINIQFGTETYQENVTISPEAFYKKIQETGVLPQTSQPSVGQFAAVYNSLAAEADEIISIHITAKLSGTYQSAKLAADKVAKRVKVEVIDSMAGSGPLGWMLCEAAQLVERGQSAAQIKAYLEAKRAAISIFFALDTLEYAQLSGRVNRLAGLLSAMLNIKPIIGLENGVIDARDKVRSSKAAMRRMVDLTQEQVQDTPVNLGVVHALAPERAEKLLRLARANLNVHDAFIKDVAISLAVHFGPGTLGLTTYPLTSVTNLEDKV